MVRWLVEEQGIEPHVAVIDKSERKDGTLSRSNFSYDLEKDVYICPDDKVLTTTGTVVSGDLYNYRASTEDCRACPLKQQCCPKDKQRKITRSIHERAKTWRERSPKPMPAKLQERIARRSRCCSPI